MRDIQLHTQCYPEHEKCEKLWEIYSKEETPRDIARYPRIFRKILRTSKKFLDWNEYYCAATDLLHNSLSTPTGGSSLSSVPTPTTAVIIRHGCGRVQTAQWGWMTVRWSVIRRHLHVWTTRCENLIVPGSPSLSHRPASSGISPGLWRRTQSLRLLSVIKFAET